MSELITEYKKSISDKNKAKLTIALGSISVIAFFSLIAINSAKSFASKAAPEISKEVSHLVLANSDRYVAEIQKSGVRILPAYSKNLELSLKQEWPNIEKEVSKEMEDLNAFAQEKYPKLREELFKIALSQEEVLERELNKILGEEKSEKIVNSYSLAALDAYKSFVKNNFSQHQKQGLKVFNSLSKLVEVEPDVSDNVSLNESIGLAMQTIGKELTSLGRQ